MIFDYPDPRYVKQQLDKLTNLNISLSQLRDDIRGSGSKTLTDIVNAINARVDTPTSVIDSRLYNATDGKSVYDHLKTLATSGIPVQNFPTWFTNSTVTTDAIQSSIDGLKGSGNRTLTDIYNRLSNIGGSVDVGNFPTWFTSSTVTTDTLKSSVDSIASKLAYANWIGKVGIGDGTNVATLVAGTLAGSSAYLLGVAPDMTKMYSGGSNYEESTVSVSTTEDSSTFSPALKFVKITNEGDTDAIIRLNDAAAPEITVPAHTGKWVLFPVSAVYYKTASGTTTLRIEGFP